MSTKKKILIIQSIDKAGIDLLDKQSNYEYEIVEDIKTENIKQKIKDCDAISLRTSKITSDILESADKLKLISRHGVGFDNIDLDSSKKNGIKIAITATANAVAVAARPVVSWLSVPITKSSVLSESS